MRRLLFAVLVPLLLPAAATAAVFSSPRYEGEVFAKGAGPFRWAFASSRSAGHAGVGYRLRTDEDPEQAWVGCLTGQQEISLSNVAPGTYGIEIADTYTEAQLLKEGKLELGFLCNAPSGGHGASDAYEVAPPTPEDKATPFEPPAEPWVGERATAAAAESQAAADAAARAREAALAREASLKAVLEREEREHAEAEQAEAEAAQAVRCVVPSLTGDSLKQARHALTKAHCRLGKTSEQHTGRGTLVVVAQSAKHGRRLPARSRIAVRLATRTRS